MMDTVRVMWGRRCVIGVLACGVFVVGCSGGGGAGGSKSDLLVTTPDPHITADAAAAELTALECAPRPEANGVTVVSSLVFEGPCPFSVHGAVSCAVRPDDFYAYLHRDLPDAAVLDATLNIENYHGPRRYDGRSTIWIQVKRNGLLYEWASTKATATVSSDQRSAAIEPSALPAWVGTPARGVETVRGGLSCGSPSANSLP